MAIKFGDTLENQNTAYPIVDVVGDNVAGVHIVDDFANDHLIAIPANARRTGSIVVAKDTGKAYIFIGTGGDITGNNNSDDEWGHAAGTNWIPAGSTTLGTPTDGDLTNGSPAISTFTADTLIVDAIDQLNETLGSLVPTAPSTWASQSQSFSFGFSTSAARLVGQTTTGSTLSHTTNGNSVTVTPGTTVNWFVDDGALDFSKTLSFDDNDQEQTQFRFHLNDEIVELSSATDATQTLLAADNSYGGNMVISQTTGQFPETGDSAGFYTGVASVAMSAAAVTSEGYNVFKFDNQTGANAVTQTLYIATEITSAGFITSGVGTSKLTKTANGTVGYTSGLTCYTNPTFTLTVTTSNLIPTVAKVYGATSSASDNNCVTFGTGSVCNAPAALTYNDLPNSTNSNVRQGDNFTEHDITGLSVRADQYRLFLLGATGGPTMNANSIHGSTTGTTVGTGDSTYVAFYDQPSNSSTLLAVFENNLHNTLHTANTAGARVQDPDSNGNSTDTPSDAVGSYGAWSQQYGNNSSSSLSLKNHDAITAPLAATGTTNFLRVRHDRLNYTSAAFEFAAATTGLNFSTRGENDPQYVTYAFPCNQELQTFTLKFKGDLDNGGDVWFKIFDSAAANSIETTNSSTGGWVPATSAYSGSGIAGAGGTGCAFGGNLSKTVTNLQTITINAGTARWHNGSDSKVYVRVKLYDGDYVEQLGLLE